MEATAYNGLTETITPVVAVVETTPVQEQMLVETVVEVTEPTVPTIRLAEHRVTVQPTLVVAEVALTDMPTQRMLFKGETVDLELWRSDTLMVTLTQHLVLV